MGGDAFAPDQIGSLLRHNCQLQQAMNDDNYLDYSGYNLRAAPPDA